MKKVFFGISMMLLSMIGFSASAQTQTNGKESAKQEQTCKKQCKSDKKCDKKGDKKGHKSRKQDKKVSREERKGNRNQQLFAGIQLNETQKVQIDALDKQMATERKAIKEEAKNRTQEAKLQNKKAMEEARNTYNLAVKEILTSEQYNQYESNRANMKARMDAKKDNRRHGHKGDRRNVKGFSVETASK